jgi:protein ImuA
MSRGGRSELDFLRQKIAAIEARGRAGLAHNLWPRRNDRPRVSLGERCSLDSWLNGGLCRGALHEIVPGRPFDAAAASGFALALAARFAAKASLSSIVWILEDTARRELGAPYGPGLLLHGIDPASLIIVQARNARESLWSMEEALKCPTLAAVIAEIWALEKAYDLTASRRLVLAAQQSGTPGLMLAPAMAGGAKLLSSAAETRFEIFSLSAPAPTPALAPAVKPLPGLGAWSARIIKARAGPYGFGFDRDRFLGVTFDPEKASFRDALPLALPSLPRDRPGRPADARTKLEHIA